MYRDDESERYYYITHQQTKRFVEEKRVRFISPGEAARRVVEIEELTSVTRQEEENDKEGSSLFDFTEI